MDGVMKTYGDLYKNLKDNPDYEEFGQINPLFAGVSRVTKWI